MNSSGGGVSRAWDITGTPWEQNVGIPSRASRGEVRRFARQRWCPVVVALKRRGRGGALLVTRRTTSQGRRVHPAMPRGPNDRGPNDRGPTTEVTHALPDDPALWFAAARAVPAAGRADRLRHDGHARDHSGAAGDGAGAGYVDQHDAVDDHAVSCRAGGGSVALWSGVGSIRAAAGAAVWPDIVYRGERRRGLRAERGCADRLAHPAIDRRLRGPGTGARRGTRQRDTG